QQTEVFATLNANTEPYMQTLNNLLQSKKCTTWNIPLDELPRDIEEISDCQSQIYRETRKIKSLIKE
ncbi:22233_t:CDS:1, partial [Cetraspora pellucida]